MKKINNFLINKKLINYYSNTFIFKVNINHKRSDNRGIKNLKIN